MIIDLLQVSHHLMRFFLADSQWRQTPPRRPPPPPPPPPFSYIILPSFAVVSISHKINPFHLISFLSSLSAITMSKRTSQASLLALATLAFFILLMFLIPSIPQPQKYHDFADKREFFGIPNALNVISNLPFLVIGFIGLMLCHHGNYFNFSLQGELWGWACFYVAVISVGFGSAYYHLGPNDNGLVCDRLPMTVAMTSLMGILIIERIDVKMGNILILPLIMSGIISSVYWRFFGDIRPYLLAQTVPCIAIPLMALLLPPMYTHSAYWLLAAGFYPLAMLQETGDRLIYKGTFHTVSGHTLKHLSAAMVPVILTVMLAKRSVYLGRLSHAKST